jgi:metallophosphoesterase (TIGR00282 family)
MKILFVADIFAQAGRRMASEHIPALLRDRDVDFVIANGENAAGGFGITDNIVRKLHSYGVDVITSGNHIWDRKEFIPQLDRNERVLRPFNYPQDAPGHGSIIAESRSGHKVAVLCLQGRTSMPTTECPFRHGRAEAERLRQETPIVFIDFHAEATAEKMALGWYLDGRVSAIIGTHTHVQTADERIFPQGTAYLTDAGMTGPHDSVIGVRQEQAIQRFLTQVPTRFKPAEDGARFCGALVEVDPVNGKATHIERLQISEDQT